MSDNILFLDIETIPSQSPTIKEEILAGLKPPGNISKAETLAKWWQEKAPALADEQYHRTGLDGTTGELLSIAWAFNQEDVQCIIRTLDQPEIMLLNQFFAVLEETNTDYLHWCAHNAEFDLSFLWKRCVILKHMPPIGIPRGRNKDIRDTMEMWAGYRDKIKFDDLCRVLGLKGKTGMDGSMVWQYVQEGRYDEIKAYNIDDVNQLRECYRRMKFLDYVPSDPEKETEAINGEDRKLEESGFFDKIQKEI